MLMLRYACSALLLQCIVYMKQFEDSFHNDYWLLFYQEFNR